MTARAGGRMLTTDAWAGYVIAKYWPEQHVFFDDRYDMYPIAMTDAYNKVLSTKPGWQKVLDDYDVDALILDADYHARTGLLPGVERSPDWRRVSQERDALLFVRETK